MPLYEYQCRDCGSKFEELISGEAEKIPCPECGSENVGRLMSMFASSGTAAGSSCSAPPGSGFS